MTASDLIKSSFRLIGVLAAGEPLPDEMAADAFNSLNQMIALWSTQNLMIFSKVFESFPLVVNQFQYQWGTGAPDFNSTRPQKIEDMNWKQVSGTTIVEIPIEIINQDQYAAIAVKTVNSNLPTRMWPQYLYPYVQLNFWPVPSVAGNIVVWSWKPLSQIANLTADISLPPGYEKMMRYNLALELAPEYGVEPSQLVLAHAIASKADVKRMNIQPLLLGCDMGVLPKRSTWNWFTGE